ncbi:MAG TPA: NlpC/P60 family protein [Spirochaetales bacterium]|nr:NlpC/P60 family protein [Spirochaetales bacterium]
MNRIVRAFATSFVLLFALIPTALVRLPAQKKSPPAKERAKADHVGIYIGDGAFVHAASSGSRAGVTINSLKERSWDERFLLAGRAISATLISGLALTLGIGIRLRSVHY